MDNKYKKKKRDLPLMLKIHGSINTITFIECAKHATTVKVFMNQSKSTHIFVPMLWNPKG